MNIILGLVNIVVTFTLVILVERWFQKEGLYAWIAIATILANLTVCKMIDVVGVTTSLGNVLFASTFLATDILSEKYGKEVAKKAVYLGLFSGVTFILITQLTLLFIPSSEDIVHSAMKALFSISIRTTIASMTMYFISNMLDVYMYNKLKEKYPDKLWLRNNVSTILCNCLENYFFNTFAFLGIFSIPVILSIATTTTLIEIIIAICDTPFIYISKCFKKDN